MGDTAVEDALLRIEALLRILVKRQLQEPLGAVLADKKMRLIYGMTGKHSVNEIAKKVGFSAGKVSGIWQNWESQGLLVKKGARYERVLG